MQERGIWNLSEAAIHERQTPRGYCIVMSYLMLRSQVVDHFPSLRASPRQALGIIRVVSESRLSQLDDTPGDDVIDGLFDGQTGANFIDQLETER